MKDRHSSKHRAKHSKRRKQELPRRMVVIPNPDKRWHESWKGKGRNPDPLNFPHPFRIVLASHPGCGKTNTVKNVLAHQWPPFKKVIVFHCNPFGTEEYDDIENMEMMEVIPKPTEWPNYKHSDEYLKAKGKEPDPKRKRVKTLVILDDLAFDSMSKEQQSNLDRLFGNVSTHCNISCMLCAQDTFNVPKCVRTSADIFVLWKGPDLANQSNVAKRTGLRPMDLEYIFRKIATGPNDSIWVDYTRHSPYPFRLNGFEPLDRKEIIDKARKKS